MQHVNDDMDHLFRRAGEQYPLQTGAPQWDKVAAALEEANALQPVQKQNRRNLLWLLLLLPGFFVCNHFWHLYSGTPQQAERHQAAKNKKTQPTTATENGVQATPPQTAKKAATPTTNHRTAQPTTTAVFKKLQKPVLQTPAPATVANQGVMQHKRKKMAAFATATNFTIERAPQASRIAAKYRQQPAQQLAHMSLHNLLPSAVYDTVKNLLTGKTIPPQAASPNYTHPKQWYAGIVGSTDLTSVRMQRTSHPGWQVGIVAGYQFRKQWSVETGLYASRKYYYTEGGYFSKSRAYQPPNSWITEVDGSCTMLEVPVSIKYDFATRTRHAWFATAGLSSYIMKKEAYDFLYYYATTNTYAVHSKSYRNASTNLFSVVQLSGGYTLSLGQNTLLRIEPFVKLPLTGLGYGKLHFTSTGMNAGLMRRF